MSYIHDALKASSEQRKATQPMPEPIPPASSFMDDDQSGKRWPWGRTLLILLLGLLLYWIWRSADEPAQLPIHPDGAEAVNPPSPEQAVPEPDLSGVKIAIRQTPEPRTAARPSAPSPAVSSTPVTPQSVNPATTQDRAEPATTEAPDPFANLPYMRQLPVEQQRELGEIRFTVHIYSDEPSSRMVKHGDRMLREGDFVRSGLRVEAIIPRAVVLQYRQTRFKVPAL
jgi:hypothetical protein